MAETIYDTGIKVKGKWRNADMYVKSEGVWTQVKPSQKVHGVWRSNYDNEIPAGAIVPFRSDAAVPTDWSVWSDADGKHIMGASKNYTAGASSAGTGNMTLTAATDGSHSTALVGFRGGGGSYAGPTAHPGHDHATSLLGSGSWEHNYVEQRLIQADKHTQFLPQDAVLFKHTSNSGNNKWNGLTQSQGASASGYLFRANTAKGNGGNHSPTGLSLTANPIHKHAGTSGGSTGGSSGSNWKGESPGTHTHASSSMTLTPNLYRVILAAWYRASGSVNINNYEKPIIMWESMKPPVGWIFCDGTNGTPDMQEHFIEYADDDTHSGAVSGDGTVTGTGTSSSDGNHDHDNNDKCGDCSKDNRMHTAIIGAHTHSLSVDETWLPPYFALSFLMKAF